MQWGSLISVSKEIVQAEKIWNPNSISFCDDDLVLRALVHEAHDGLDVDGGVAVEGGGEWEVFEEVLPWPAARTPPDISLPHRPPPTLLIKCVGTIAIIAIAYILTLIATPVSFTMFVCIV